MRWISLLSSLCALTLIISARAEGPSAATPPADAQPVTLTVELSDGSRVIGVPSVSHLKMTTPYTEMDIQLALIRTLEFTSPTDRTAKVNLQNGDLLKVNLAATDITLKTIFGKAVIPMAQVRRIQLAAAAGSWPDGLVFHFAFDKDENGRVTDSGGSDITGDVRGPAFVKEGKVGGAMSFNGTRQLIIVKNQPALQLQDFTIMAWIKRGSGDRVSKTSPDGQIFGFGELGYILGLHEDGRIFVSKVGVDGVFSSFQITDEAFHHVALTKKGNKIVFFLDGVAHPAEDYDTNFQFDTDAAVGARSDDQGGSFLGLIDEVALFKRPLTAEEVKGIYDSQK